MNKVLAKAIQIAGNQTVLANAIGVDPCYISQWLNRNRRGIPTRYILPISKATGMPVEELLQNRYEGEK